MYENVSKSLRATAKSELHRCYAQDFRTMASSVTFAAALTCERVLTYRKLVGSFEFEEKKQIDIFG